MIYCEIELKLYVENKIFVQSSVCYRVKLNFIYVYIFYFYVKQSVCFTFVKLNYMIKMLNKV